MDASTTGSAQQHKIKTINVEVNLLDAWAVQRVELETKVVQKLVVLVVILVSGLLLIPVLSSLGAEQENNFKTAESALNSNMKQKADLEKQSKQVEPGIERDEVVTRCHIGSEEFLNEVCKIFGATSPQMFFEHMSAEVANGECVMKVTANANSPEVGRAFVAEAEKGTNVLDSTQTSAKQTQLSETSIKFDYTKKVELGR